MINGIGVLCGTPWVLMSPSVLKSNPVEVTLTSGVGGVCIVSRAHVVSRAVVACLA